MGILRWKGRTWHPPQFDGKGLTQWNWMAQYTENLKLGRYVDIGAFTYINARYGVIIEDFVQIGSHCAIYSESSIDGKRGPVVIRKNARVGSHSVILPGVTIGENAIVGAFSLVKDDIPDNVVAFGIPARVVRKLTDEEISQIRKAMEEIERSGRI